MMDLLDAEFSARVVAMLLTAEGAVCFMLGLAMAKKLLSIPPTPPTDPPSWWYVPREGEQVRIVPVRNGGVIVGYMEVVESLYDEYEEIDQNV